MSIADWNKKRILKNNLLERQDNVREDSGTSVEEKRKHNYMFKNKNKNRTKDKRENVACKFDNGCNVFWF